MSDSPRGDSEARPPRLDPWLIAAFVLLLPLYLLPNYAYYQDTIGFANDVEFRGLAERIHPHHIGYSTLVWLLWKPLDAIGLDIRALDLMHALSRGSALGCIALIGILLRMQGVSTPWSALGMLLFGTAFTAWQYGTTGAVYLPTLFCLLMIYGHLLSWIETGPTLRSAKMVAGWFVLGLVMHQLVALVLIPIGVWAWTTGKGKENQTPEVGWVRVVLLAGVPSLALYLLAFVLGSKDDGIGSFLKWATAYGHDTRYWVWERVPEGESLAGHWWHLLAESHMRVLWAMPQRLWAEPFGEIYEPITTNAAAHNFQSVFPSEFFYTAIPRIVGLLVILLIASGWRLWTQSRAQRSLLQLALLWTLPLLLFSAIFMPSNAFYRLYYFLPLMSLPLLAAAHGRARRVTDALLALVWSALFGFGALMTFAYGIAPRQSASINPWYTPYANRLPFNPLPSMTGSIVMLFRGHHGDWREYEYALQFSSVPVYRGEWMEASPMDASEPARVQATVDWLAGPPERTILYSHQVTDWRSGQVLHAVGRPGDPDLWLYPDALRHWGGSLVMWPGFY